MDALTLFDAPEDTSAGTLPNRRKRHGREVSGAAYGTVDLPARQAQVLDALRRRPGATASELTDLVHMPANCVVRRLRDLAERGLAVEVGTKAGDSGRQQIAWRAA